MITYLRNGALAGLAGGAAMAVALQLLGEPSIRDALDIEAARSAGEEGTEMFSRGAQLAGGSLALLLYGAAVGAIFGVVFAAVRHRSRLRTDFERALGLGAVAFGVLVLVPALKYPANPPAVGDPSTVDQRTVAYLTLVAISVVVAIGVWRASRYLRVRGVADHVRISAVAAGYVAAIALVYALWPGNPDAIEVPATLIWRFRLAAIGGAAALWSVLAITFGWVCMRSARKISGDINAGERQLVR